MSKKSLYFLLLILASCNSPQQPGTPPAETSQASQPKQDIPPTSEPYFNGISSDNTWTMSIEAQSDGAFKVVLNHEEYGLKEFLFTKDPLIKEGQKSVKSGEVAMSNGKDILRIIAAECTDYTGKKHTHECVLKTPEFSVSGCGEYLD